MILQHVCLHLLLNAHLYFHSDSQIITDLSHFLDITGKVGYLAIRVNNNIKEYNNNILHNCYPHPGGLFCIALSGCASKQSIACGDAHACHGVCGYHLRCQLFHMCSTVHDGDGSESWGHSQQ
jgi:hypothetical protein